MLAVIFGLRGRHQVILRDGSVRGVSIMILAISTDLQGSLMRLCVSRDPWFARRAFGYR